MATEHWIGGSGVGLTWSNAFTGSTLNSIASGNAILSDLQIDNSTALDIYSDFSMNLASAAIIAPNFVGVYLYPLNADNSTFGDGRFGSSAAGPPAAPYWVGNIVIPTGTAANEGTVRGIIMPPGKFKFVVFNQTGVAFNASGNTAQYRTYNRQVS
jgi:hypothetical protein